MSRSASIVLDLRRFDCGDTAAIERAAQSLGRLESARPIAVIRPRSVDEIVDAVAIARRYHVPLTARGQGWSTGAQALAAGGIVLAMGAHARVRSVSDHVAVVDAGVTWADVLAATLPRGLRPAVLTDYQGLSVGGTLSAGGIGGESFRAGAQVDHVRELVVVTGACEVVRCSPAEARGLFDAARAGLGRFGVIAEAHLALVPAPAAVRSVTVRPAALPDLFAALRAFTADPRVLHLVARVEPRFRAGWKLELSATQDATAAALEGAGPARPFVTHTRQADRFAHRALAEPLAHPWLHVFLPLAAAEDFVAAYLARPAARCALRLHPVRRSLCRAPMLRLPDGEEIVLIDVLPSSGSEGLEALRWTLEARWHEARELGGTLYPVGAVGLSPADWRRHYGEIWDAVVEARHTFDPGELFPR
jgi:cytokinin dehydrogenase